MIAWLKRLFGPGSLDWATTAEFLAQSAHMGWAMAITTIIHDHGWPLWPLWLTAPFAAGLKEFYWDMKDETSANWGNQTLDFCMWMLGMIVGSAICYWR